MNRFWVGAVLMLLLGILFLSGPEQGFSSECFDGVCHVRAATSLIALIVSPVMIAFALLYRQRLGAPVADLPVTVIRRVAAMFIDFVLVLSATAPATALLLLLTEASEIGAFAWSFERNFARASDLIALPAVLLTFLALFGYFYGHARIGRPTIGQYLLGFKVGLIETPVRGRPIATNMFMAIIGLGVWPVSVWLAVRRPDKAFWWNLRTGMRAVTVRNADTP